MEVQHRNGQIKQDLDTPEYQSNIVELNNKLTLILSSITSNCPSVQSQEGELDGVDHQPFKQVQAGNEPEEEEVTNQPSPPLGEQQEPLEKPQQSTEIICEKSPSDQQLIQDIMELSKKWSLTRLEDYCHVDLFTQTTCSPSASETASSTLLYSKKFSMKVEKCDDIPYEFAQPKGVAPSPSYCVEKYSKVEQPEKCNCILF